MPLPEERNLKPLRLKPRIRLGGLALGLGIGLAALLATLLAPGLGGALAARLAAPPEQVGVDNEYCYGCHGEPDQQITLPSGEILYLTVERSLYDSSVHGRTGYACVQCHREIREYPHPELDAQTRREVSLSMYPACAHCHNDKYVQTMDSVHEQALESGNPNAAVCTDCHGAHNVSDPTTFRSQIPKTCERCHSEIYNLYAESVHGAALTEENNLDVPTCIDCHGVHNVEGPANTPFRLNSPLVCARCHTDETMMAKYGLSTDVLNTYVADFHGSTVTLFQQTAEGQETNKPVCVDCHSVHDIRKTDDPQSTVIKENLLDTCQRCHPDATTNFSAAWLSHYRPSPQHYPVVYYVDLFYKLFIPGVLGFMALFVVSDIGRRVYNRRVKGAAHE